MHVLIVESRQPLAESWSDHLRGLGWTVFVAHDQAAAIQVLQTCSVQVMLLDLVLDHGSALAVADYAGFRHPDLQVVFLTDTAVFSDGSIFAHCANARAFLQAQTPVTDLGALVEHLARAA